MTSPDKKTNTVAYKHFNHILKLFFIMCVLYYIQNGSEKISLSDISPPKDEASRPLWPSAHDFNYDFFISNIYIAAI